MGIATWHEVKPARSSSTSPLEGEVGAKRREGGKGPRKPSLDEMGPGVESVPAKSSGVPDEARSAKAGPRSTLGRPGMRGGWKGKKR